MIEQLTVKDYILFQSGQMEFDRDMAVITGETGAGKSLLIDAIGLLCGQRAGKEVVREGADKAVLTMVLSGPDPETKAFLEDAGFDAEDELVITRIISRTGKSSVRINQQPATLSFLKQLTARLIDVHSQMDTITLMDPKVQLALLDQYAKNETELEAVRQAYKAYVHARKELDTAANETYSDDELDFTTARLNEIDQANVKEGELEELQANIKACSRLAKTEEEIGECLYQLGRENGLLDTSYLVARSLKKMDGMEQTAGQVQDFYHAMDALKEELQDKLDALRSDSRNLDQMQEREHLLRQLFRKYGGSWQAMMDRRQELEEKIDRILHRQDVLEKLEKQKKAAEKELKAASAALSAARKAVIPELETAILSHASDLMLENARFEIRMEPQPYTASGSDAVAFYASMNPGIPLSPIQKSASGGELSRLMLALKTVFQTGRGIDTIIFDEIDTGVSGKVALAMGSKMHLLAGSRQVLCITHLASVAVYGDEHFQVAKETDGTMTRTTVSRLEGEDIVRELSMMANGQVSDSSLQGMRELQERVHHGKSSVSH